MPDAASQPNDQFWLLTGEVPTGPFTVAQIHTKLAAGDVAWQSPACPVGGNTWRPLVQTPGIGPGAVGSDGTPSATGPSPQQPEPKRPTPPPLPAPVSPPALPHTPLTPTPSMPVDPPSARYAGGSTSGTWRRLALVSALVAIVGIGAYWVYDAVRPPTATEVCKKLDEVKTATEARKYVTPRMHPFVDAAYASGTGLDPNDSFNWTQEVDGPQPGTKLVGFRGSFFLPETGRRVAMEGHVRLVKSDGWKVDDMVVTGVEGAALPGPVSLAEEYAPPATALVACRRLNSAKSAAEAKKYATARVYPLVDAIAADKSSPDPNDAFEIAQEVDGGNPGTRKVGFRGSWYDQPAARRVAVEGHFRVVMSDGWKVDDVVFTGVEGTALPQPMSLVDEHRRAAPPPPTADKLLQASKNLPHLGKSPALKLPSPVQRPWYESLKDRYGWGGVAVLVLVVVGRIIQVVISAPSRKKAAKP